MNKSANIITRPHSRHAARFVDPEKKKRVEYAMAERREKQGKTVIHLHEKPPAFKVWPSPETMAGLILAFYQASGQTPTRITVPFQSQWSRMGWPCKGLPADPVWDLKDGRGRFVEMDVIYDPDAMQVTLA